MPPLGSAGLSEYYHMHSELHSLHFPHPLICVVVTLVFASFVAQRVLDVALLSRPAHWQHIELATQWDQGLATLSCVILATAKIASKPTHCRSQLVSCEIPDI